MTETALRTARELCNLVGIGELPLDQLIFTGNPRTVVDSTFSVGDAAQVCILKNNFKHSLQPTIPRLS